MEFEVIWSEPAFAEFEAIIDHIAEQNPVSAEKMRIEILDHVNVLSRFPWIGPEFRPDATSRCREILCGRYRIFYRVAETAGRVEILTLWHGFRDEPSYLET